MHPNKETLEIMLRTFGLVMRQGTEMEQNLGAALLLSMKDKAPKDIRKLIDAAAVRAAS